MATDLHIPTDVLSALHGLASDYSYNPKKRKYYSKTREKFYDLSEAAEDCFNKFCSESPALYQTFVAHKDALRDRCGEIISDLCKKKIKKHADSTDSNRAHGVLTTSLDNKSDTNDLWIPQHSFNMRDAELCEGILFHTEHNTVYYEAEDGSLTPLGVVNKVSDYIANELANMYVKRHPDFDLHEDLSHKMNMLTKLYNQLKAHEESGIDYVVDNSTWRGIKLRDWLELKDYTPKDLREVVTRCIFQMLNCELPATMFCKDCKIYKSYDLFLDDDGKTHTTDVQGFFYRSAKTGSALLTNYYKNIIENHLMSTTVIDDDPKSVRVNDGDHGFGCFNQELFDEDAKTYKSKYEDSKLLKTYLSPMTSAQATFTTAWWYAACNPHLNIYAPALFQKDEGGTLKNTMYKAVQRCMQRYYGVDEVFYIKDDQITKDTYLYNSKTHRTIADYALCYIDEVATKGATWDAIKSLTGGTTVDVPIKMLYSNPFTQRARLVFYISSNKPVYIQDKNAFQRRLAIIHTRGNNTYKQLSNEDLRLVNEDDDTILREYHLLMKYGKVAYDSLCAQYGNLTNAALNIKEIVSELDDANVWDDYLAGFYASLFDGDRVQIKISNNDIDRLFYDYQQNNRTKVDVGPQQARNYCRNAHPENQAMKFWNKDAHKTVHGWVLNKIEDTNEDGLEEYKSPVHDDFDSLLKSRVEDVQGVGGFSDWMAKAGEDDLFAKA